MLGGVVELEAAKRIRTPQTAHVEKQLEFLNEEHREVLVLRYMEELSYEEIADILGLSLGTVKSRIHRARNELRDVMTEYL